MAMTVEAATGRASVFVVHGTGTLERGVARGNPQLQRSGGRSSASPVLRHKFGLLPLPATKASCGVSLRSTSALRPSLSVEKRISQSRTASVVGAPLDYRSSTFSFGLAEQKYLHEKLGPVCALKESASADTSATEDSKSRNIWLSDVVPTRTKPYFINRSWTGKDITYATYMIIVHALCLAAPFTFSWSAFGVFGILYFITGCLGITLSYHRNLSHKSFKLPKWLEYTFAYCGVQAVQGDPIEWVSSHRYHHQYCDTEMDPHSPYEGFWHSHMGWLLDDTSTEARVGARANIGDMEKDPFYKWIQKTYIFHPIALGAALFALGGFPYVVWGMAVRSVWVYHITWFVNSASHVWGYQSWKTGDLSRNNWWVALLAFGEGWHNNHHAFEYSARHGLEWWQLDPTYYIVKMLQAVGLATKVKVPSNEHKQKLAFPAANPSL